MFVCKARHLVLAGGSKVRTSGEARPGWWGLSSCHCQATAEGAQGFSESHLSLTLWVACWVVDTLRNLHPPGSEAAGCRGQRGGGRLSLSGLPSLSAPLLRSDSTVHSDKGAADGVTAGIKVKDYRAPM